MIKKSGWLKENEGKENNLCNAELIKISKGCVASQPYNVWIVKGSCSNSVFSGVYQEVKHFSLKI